MRPSDGLDNGFASCCPWCHECWVYLNPIDAILASFKEEVEHKLKTVDERIRFGMNSHIKIGKNKKTWNLPYEKSEDDTNHSFYEQLPLVSIGDVLHFVNEQFLGKNVRSYADEGSLSASILAQGLNIGLKKMDEISDINYAEFATTTNNLSPYSKCEW